jgi:Na+/pantothenate symporter
MYNGKEINKKLNVIFIVSFIILVFFSMTGIPYIILNWQHW